MNETEFAQMLMRKILVQMKLMNKTGVASIAQSYLDLKANKSEENLSQIESEYLTLFKSFQSISKLPKLINSSIEDTPIFQGFQPCDMEQAFHAYSDWSNFGQTQDYALV